MQHNASELSFYNVIVFIMNAAQLEEKNQTLNVLRHLFQRKTKHSHRSWWITAINLMYSKVLTVRDVWLNKTRLPVITPCIMFSDYPSWWSFYFFFTASSLCCLFVFLNDYAGVVFLQFTTGHTEVIVALTVSGLIFFAFRVQTGLGCICREQWRGVAM